MKRRQFVQSSGLALIASTGITSTVLSKDNKTNYQETGARLLTDSTPAADGFHFPGEWERHEYTIMVLPPPQNWLGYGIPMKNVRQQWADVANTLNEYEPVLMVVRPEDKKFTQRILSRDIELVELPVNDGWSRDSGPMFVVDGKGNRRVAGFTFNGWGAKFPPYRDDALLKARLCKHLEVPMYPVDLVLEGGSVVLDGEGTVVTTEQCLLHKNRNPGKSKAEIEKLLNQSLGTKKVIWLGKGIEPDDVTDGHADGLVAFAAPGVVLLHTTSDRSDPNFAIGNDARRRLQKEQDAKGRKLEIIEIPLGLDVAHMNFYIANGCVLVPIAEDRRQDRRPLAILREAFPQRKIIGISGKVLSEGGGGIHCITQQVPQVAKK